ncbi:unnamed protein product [Cercospora beticola]|nr:unnamed protein product [Cercospora beticola]
MSMDLARNFKFSSRGRGPHFLDSMLRLRFSIPPQMRLLGDANIGCGLATVYHMLNSEYSVLQADRWRKVAHVLYAPFFAQPDYCQNVGRIPWSLRAGRKSTRVQSSTDRALS